MALLLAATVAQAGAGLSNAATKGDLVAVKAALAAGEKINEVDRWGWTPLLWSVFYEKLPVTLYLLDQGADPNCKAGAKYHRIKAGSTPLIIAGYYGMTAVVEPLLRHGARPELTDAFGYRAVDYAKQFQFTEVTALLEPGAAQALPASR
jgi:ankyrin repeat protein